ncbi:MAG: OmpA family protein, partial [Candidatus Marinimicrobia bacterium]|nr:OmpA family protein [Candidatus Neomarinimicrobiota bacterium]
MNKYLLICIVFVFFACGGGKEGVSEKTETEQVSQPKTVEEVTAPKSISPDSLAALFDGRKVTTKKPEVVIKKEIQPQKQVKKPIFVFRIEPPKEYEIISGKNLNLIIGGNQNAFVSFSWIKPDGKRIVEKQREITEKKYIRPLKPETVKKYLGTGLKTITATITYDKSRPPMKLSKTIRIIETTPKPKITKSVSDTVKTVLKPIKKVQLEKQIPAKDITYKEEKVAEEVEKKLTKREQPLLVKKLTFDDIFFDSGEWAVPSLTFNSNYFITLSKLVKALRTDKDIKVRLYGHTDSDGSIENNKVLAEKRTITIGKLLLKLFQDEERESIAERIELVGVGKVEPLIEGTNKMREVLNRRVSIELAYDYTEGETLADYLTTKKIVTKREIKPEPVEKAYKPKKIKSPQKRLYENAGRLFSEKQYDEAISIYEEIISFDPNN